MSGFVCSNEGKERRCFWAVYWTNFAAILLWYLYVTIPSFSEREWGVTEFLINYQGGYVRRGLMGEFLHSLCEMTGWDPRVVILPLCLFAFCGFCAILRIFIRKMDFFWPVLLTNYGLFGASFIRKDHIVFLCLIAALWLYSQIKQRMLKFVLPLLLIVFMLHLHEASFFYCVPVYLLVIFSDRTATSSLAEKVAHVACVCITMVVLCLNKGNETIAQDIVNSWQFIYPETYHQLYASSIAAIGWSSSHAFAVHYNWNFVDGSIPYSGFVLRPLALLVIFFLMVRLGLKNHLKKDTLPVEQFIFLLIVLLVTLLPMLTLLSCDFQRVACYWTMSAMIGLYYLRNTEIFGMRIPVVRQSIARIRSIVLKSQHSKIPYAVLLLFNIPFMENSLWDYTSPAISLAARVVYKILEILA